LILFLAAVVLYAPGLWWGLPYATAADRVKPWGADELAPLGPIAELYSVVRNGNPTQHGFSFNPQYPLFHYVVQAVFVGPYMVGLWLSGQLGAPSVHYPYGLADPVSALACMTLAARFSSVLLAAAVVVAAYRTAHILWGRDTAMIAGPFVLLLYPAFYYARTSNVDIGALCWTTFGLTVFATCLRDGITPRRAAWLGTWAALATATKDQSYAVFLVVGAVLAYRSLAGRERAERYHAARALAVGLVTGAAVYAVASGLVLHPGRYWAHLDFVARGGAHSYFANPSTVHGYVTLASETVAEILESLGAPLAVTAVIGMVLCLRRAPHSLVFALPAIGVLLGVIVPARFVQLRFVMPIAYLMALYAAYAVTAALRDRRTTVRWIGLASLIVCASWSLLRGVDLTYAMLFDSRYEMASWLRTHMKGGERLGYYGDPLKLPHLDASMTAEAMPGQIVMPWPWKAASTPPAFVAVIPVWPFEPVHEWSLPPKIYRTLEDGSSGYRRALAGRTGSLFQHRSLAFVNPPAQLFVRVDRSVGALPAEAMALPTSTPRAAENGRHPLGTVRVMSLERPGEEPYQYEVTVSCPDLDDQRAELLIGDPMGPRRGTILFASGFIGGFRWEDIGAEAPRVIQDLRDAGFRTVQLRWKSNWFLASAGHVSGHGRLACRPATVLRWVDEFLHIDDFTLPFCAVGHSNGASQLAYALSRYGLGDVLSLVVLDGGPNFARLDVGCLHDDGAAAAWFNLESRRYVDWGFGHPSDGSGPCARQDQEYRRAFQDASLALGEWEYHFPHTMVWFIAGARDDTATVVQGRLFQERLAQAASPLLGSSTVADAAHLTADTQQGGDAIRDILLRECVRREHAAPR